jgi:hypothetical protein
MVGALVSHVVNVFVCNLTNDVVSSSDYVASNIWIINDVINWKTNVWKTSWVYFKVSTGICLDGLRKSTKNIDQDSRCPAGALQLPPSCWLSVAGNGSQGPSPIAEKKQCLMDAPRRVVSLGRPYCITS